MNTDKLHIECPCCRSFVSVTTYNGINKKEDFCVEEAPLSIIQEVNEASRNGKVECFSCGAKLALVVRFMAYPVPLEEKQQYSRKWRKV